MGASVRKLPSADDPRALYKRRLQESGLSEKSARELRLTLLSPEEVQKLGFNKQAAVKIPYFDATGKPTGFFRLRYLGAPKGFAAEAESGGKSNRNRYRQVDGTLNEVYLPPLLKKSWQSIFEDTETPIYFTEGEFKSAAGAALNLPVIGLGGVQMFRASKRGFSEVLPQLEEINWKERPVAIIWDSDVGTKSDAIAAQRRLAYELARRGAAPVKMLAFPASGEKKIGLDDYLLEHKAEDFKNLVNEAADFEEASALWSMNEEVTLIEQPPVIVRRKDSNVMSPKDFVNVLYADRKYTALDDDGKPKKKLLPREWLAWPQRFKLKQMTYKPGEPKIIDEEREWNQWDGWGVEAKKGDITPWKELLDFLFRDAEPGARVWFEKWCAYPIQYPGTKLFSAVVIWGAAHGTGKTIAGLTLKDIYGKNGIKIGEKQLHGNFNSWAKNKQFVLGEEITGKDQNIRKELANELKDLITGEDIEVNVKYLPEYTLPNKINFYFTSNSPAAFFLEDFDRRYFIIEVTGTPLPEDFYKRYDRWRKKEGGPAALRSYLENLDVSDFNPKGHAFETEAKRDMIFDNKSDIARWCFELKSNPAKALMLLPNAKAAAGCDLFTTAQLYNLFNPGNDSRRGSLNSLSRELKSAGFRKPNGGKIIGTKAGPQKFWAIRNAEKWLRAERMACADHWSAYWIVGGKY